MGMLVLMMLLYLSIETTTATSLCEMQDVKAITFVIYKCYIFHIKQVTVFCILYQCKLNQFFDRNQQMAVFMIIVCYSSITTNSQFMACPKHWQDKNW